MCGRLPTQTGYVYIHNNIFSLLYRVSLYNPDWPICCAEQAELELIEICMPLPFQVLGLNVCITMLNRIF